MARLAEAKVIKGKGKTKGKGQFPLWAKAKAKAKAMAKLKAKARHPKVVMYMRTSSAANVGDDKDSESRQRARCQEFADNRSMTIMQEYKDPAVSGTDPLISRPGFSRMVADCIEYDIRPRMHWSTGAPNAWSCE